jgi:putative hemin transport protein
MPGARSVELDAGRWEELLRAFEGLEKVHVIVSNASVTCEVNGRFGGFSTSGEFFNVQSQSLDLHIRHAQLAAAFAVVKPSHMDRAGPDPATAEGAAGFPGRATLSFQFFDREGSSALKVFLNFGGPCPPERAAQFLALRDRFRQAPAPA